MHNGFKDRMMAYFSGIIQPVYECYQLRPEPNVAIHRYCSFNTLKEYGVFPKPCDYDLIKAGVLDSDKAVPVAIEEEICEKNKMGSSKISVGDIFKVFKN